MGDQWENYSCAQSMGKHVDVCQGSDILMDSCLHSLHQVGNKIERIFGLCCQVTKSTASQLLMTIVI
jgi:hypothetical protein